jgi:repressor LexA
MTQLDEHGKRIIAFIKNYQRTHRRSPSYQEIGAAMGITSKDHVSRDLRKLREQGCLSFTPGVSRSIVLLKDGRSRAGGGRGTIPLPVFGTMAESGPGPIVDSNLIPLDWASVARDLVRDEQDVYVLQVRGISMLDALLDDGDLIVLKRGQAAQNGEMVAAWLKSQQTMTLRYYHRENGHVRLQPANPALPSLNVEPSDVEIRGQVIAIVHKTRPG